MTDTKSICPKCKKILDANVIFESNKTKIIKKCPEHGKFKATHMHDTKTLYKVMNQIHNTKSISKRNKNNIPEAYEGLFLILNNNCNLNCPVCFEGDKDNFDGLEEESIRHIGEKYKTRGGRVSLVGGEPTVDPNLKKYISSLKERNFEIHLNTNGLMISDKNYLKELKDKGVDGVSISFEGFKEEVYEKLRGKNIKNKIIKSINNLKELNVPYGLSTIILKSNIDEIGKIIDFAFTNNASSITFKPISYSDYNQQEELKEEVLNLSDILNKLKKELNLTYKDIAETTEFLHLYNTFQNYLKFKSFKNTKCYLYILLEKDNEKINKINNRKYFKILFNLLKLIKIPLILEAITLFKPILSKISDTFKSYLAGDHQKTLMVSIKSSMNSSNLDLNYLEECNCNQIFDKSDLKQPRSACEYKTLFRREKSKNSN